MILLSSQKAMIGVKYSDKYVSVNANLKIPNYAGLKIPKTQTSGNYHRGLTNVEHGGFFVSYL